MEDGGGLVAGLVTGVAEVVFEGEGRGGAFGGGEIFSGESVIAVFIGGEAGGEGGVGVGGRFLRGGG
jgi:hypothetical protein